MSSTIASTATASSTSAGLVNTTTNPAFKIVGVCLAIGSGVFIGTSFVIKKKGLLIATSKSGNKAGEGHGYLKSWVWWLGRFTFLWGDD